MKYDAVKLELIEWIIKLEDEETINYLKVYKDSNVSYTGWWNELTEDQKSEIEQGLKDIDEGRVTPHDIVERRYNL